MTVGEETAAGTTSRRSPMRSAVARCLQFGRYHGIWAPGVRLLRAQPLWRQGATVLAVTVLPLTFAAILAIQRSGAELKTATDAQQGAAAVIAVIHAADATLAEAEQPSPKQAALLASERQQLLTRLSAFAANDAGTVNLLDLLRRRWQATAAADLHGDLRDIGVLHDRILTLSKLESHPDPAVRAFFGGPTDLLPRLCLALHGARMSAAGLAGGDDVARRRAVESLDRSLTEVDVRLEIVRAIEERAIATGLLENDSVRAALRHLDRFDDAAHTLRHAIESNVQVVGSAELERFTALTLAAEQAVMSIEVVNMTALETYLVDMRHALIDRLLREALLLLCGVLLAAYVLACVYKVVSGGVRKLCANVVELAAGNLSIRPVGYGQDEISVALNALRGSAERLSQTFSVVTQGVGAVSHAAREVATGNRGVADSTGAIRAAIVSVTTRANDFAALMHACGSEVELAVSQVRSMRSDARRSRNAMAGLRERMRALNAKSREINQVVKLMEAVAFQTKLLALNASVEAARAGTEGKGFAVVAQEVRALALRNEQSAQRIHAIVASSIAEIDECNRMTEEASLAVSATDERIESVHRSMGDIVAQTQAGMTGSRDVAGITREADASMGGNARIVDQLSAASADLRDQGDALRRSVQHFLVA